MIDKYNNNYERSAFMQDSYPKSKKTIYLRKSLANTQTIHYIKYTF